MITLHNVKMHYPNGEGIENVSLSIKPGEFVFLVGPSGAGKSTVLKVIYMEKFPQDGHVIVKDFSSLFMRRQDIPYLRRKLGIVFQDFKLLSDRNVFENVAFALEKTKQNPYVMNIGDKKEDISWLFSKRGK